ncbi:MAG: HDOD domain-containing protein [Thermodesulfobacteriota bacterium]
MGPPGQASHVPNDTANIFIARQPIFRRDKALFGYELLFRSGLENFFAGADGEAATSKVITNSFLLIGIKNLTEGKKAFINFTQGMLVKEYPTLFPRRETVVEILENVPAVPPVLAACRSLASQGYVLAMDDFVYTPAKLPFLEHVQIIKFDLQQQSLEEMAEVVERFRRQKPSLRFLAEKIETESEFQASLAMGCHFFQGYFFSRPNIVVGRDIPGSKLTYLQIIRRLQDESYHFDQLAQIIGRDVSLSYKLLKYVNSAAFYRPQEISSLKAAIGLLGEVHLRKWLSLMMLSYMAADKPSELLRLSVLRARLCELVAERGLGAEARTGEFFLVGMFSLLDAILDQPMERLLAELSLPEELTAALLGKDNRLQHCLALVQAYEQGDWTGFLARATSCGVDAEAFPSLYMAAIDWVRSCGLAD